MVAQTISFPYGRSSVAIEVPDGKQLSLCRPEQRQGIRDLESSLKKVLRSPLNSKPLRDLARDAENAAVVVDDTTRAVPTPQLLDTLIPELEAGGIGLSRITVVVAVGLHRPIYEDEKEMILGKWSGKVRLESHDANDEARLVPLETTSLGTSLSVNRTFLEADLKILTGDVEYHQFCGYGGGAKSIYPGLADAEAIRLSHSRLEWPGTEPGRVAGNPVREEIEEVGGLAGVDFSLCTVLNSEGQIVSVHAGELSACFTEACSIVDEIYRRQVPSKADLVIASAGGFPRDSSLYQAQKALATAARVVRREGTIVVIAACEEGSGSALFEEWMTQAVEPEDIKRRLQEKFVMGGHKAYQIARDLSLATVYLLSELPPGQVRSWFLKPLRNRAEIELLVKRAERVIAVPEATTTLVECKK